MSTDPGLGTYFPERSGGNDALPSLGGVAEPKNLSSFSYAHNNPLKLTDRDGKWVGIDDAIATGGGAIAGVVVQGAVDLVRWERSGWRTYVAAGLGGAATGEATLYTGPFVAGAAGGAVYSGTEQLLNGEFSAGRFAVDTMTSAVGGKVLHSAGTWVGQSSVGQWFSGQASRVFSRGCSFAAATPVATPEGLRPIGELKAGDRVLARDEVTGAYAFKPIRRTYQHQDPVKVRLTLENPATGATEVIETTPQHPFHVPGRGFLVLLRQTYHRFFRLNRGWEQHGHRWSRAARRTAISRRRVAIESGTWRSVRIGSAPGSVIFGKGRHFDDSAATRL